MATTTHSPVVVLLKNISRRKFLFGYDNIYEKNLPPPQGSQFLPINPGAGANSSGRSATPGTGQEQAPGVPAMHRFYCRCRCNGNLSYERAWRYRQQAFRREDPRKKQRIQVGPAGRAGGKDGVRTRGWPHKARTLPGRRDRTPGHFPPALCRLHARPDRCSSVRTRPAPAYP